MAKPNRPQGFGYTNPYRPAFGYEVSNDTPSQPPTSEIYDILVYQGDTVVYGAETIVVSKTAS